jgi:hypothetical protein
MKSSILVQYFVLFKLSIAGYVLEDDYNPSNLLDEFTAFSGPDPTQGFGMCSGSYRSYCKLTVEQWIWWTCKLAYPPV